MRCIKNIFLLTIFYSFFVASTFADSITIVVENNWPPYSNGDGTGISNQIVKAAFASIGVDVSLLPMPYARATKLVEQGSYVAGFNVGKNLQTKDLFLFGKKPIIEITSSYYVNANKPLKLRNRDQLKNGETIAAVRGFNYGFHFENLVNNNWIRTEITHSEKQSLRMLLVGRIDATILADETATMLINEMGLHDQITFGFVNETHPVYLAFSSKHPKAVHFMEAFDRGMDIIHKNGTYQKILARYQNP